MNIFAKLSKQIIESLELNEPRMEDWTVSLPVDGEETSQPAFMVDGKYGKKVHQMMVEEETNFPLYPKAAKLSYLPKEARVENVVKGADETHPKLAFSPTLSYILGHYVEKTHGDLSSEGRAQIVEDLLEKLKRPSVSATVFHDLIQALETWWPKIEFNISVDTTKQEKAMRLAAEGIVEMTSEEMDSAYAHSVKNRREIRESLANRRDGDEYRRIDPTALAND